MSVRNQNMDGSQNVFKLNDDYVTKITLYVLQVIPGYAAGWILWFDKSEHIRIKRIKYLMIIRQPICVKAKDFKCHLVEQFENVTFFS